MLNFNSILVSTTQPQQLAAFYEGVFGGPPGFVDDDNGVHGWQVGSAFFAVLNHSQMNGKAKEPGRVLVNFETAQVQAEFARIKGLGAAVVQEPYEIGSGWVATLADPDGNYFQLMTPMEMG